MDKLDEIEFSELFESLLESTEELDENDSLNFDLRSLWLRDLRLQRCPVPIAELIKVLILTWRSNFIVESFMLVSGSTRAVRALAVASRTVKGSSIGELAPDESGFFFKMLFDGLTLSCLIAWLTCVMLKLWLVLESDGSRECDDW